MPTDRAQDTEAIRAALERSRASLELIGDGDWTPQDAAHSSLCDVADRLVARLEADERVVRAAQEFLNCDEGTDIQFLSEDGIDFYNALDAALAAAAPGETEQTP